MRVDQSKIYHNMQKTKNANELIATAADRLLITFLNPNDRGAIDANKGARKRVDNDTQKAKKIVQFRWSL